MKRRPLFLAMALALGLTACATNAEPAATMLSRFEFGSVKQAHAFGDILLTSQPSHADFRQAKRDFGVKTVVNLRMPDEMAALNDAKAIGDLGLSYKNIGFKAPKTLTNEIFVQVRALLRSPEHRPLLLHCKSANRVGAIWYAFRVLDNNIDEDKAMAEAKRIGLKKEGHIARTRAYVKQMLR